MIIAKKILGDDNMNENEVYEAQIDDYEMEPNPNGRGRTLYSGDVITDKLLSVQTTSIIGLIVFGVILLSMLISEGNSASSDDSLGTIILIWILCLVVNIISDKKVSKNFSQIEYKNPCICSEKRFYMEAAKAVQDAGFETEKGFFDSLINGRGFMVTKTGLFDYTMVVTFDPQTNTFSVANKKIVGRAGIEDFAYVVENQLYSKNCPRVVNAIQKRLDHCAHSADRCKEENLNSDTSFILGLAGDYVKGIVRYAVVVIGVLVIGGAALLFA